MKNDKIKQLIKESVLRLISNTTVDAKTGKIIEKHEVKTHFVPIRYRIFGGLLQSLNIQFGNFIEVLMQRRTALKLSGKYLAKRTCPLH